MPQNAPPNFVVLGQLKRTFLLPPSGRPLLDSPGGNALYAAAGLSVWAEQIGLVARVGEDYPRGWLADFEKYGIDTRGVQIVPEALDLREFIAYSNLSTRHTDNPVAHFAQRSMPFPKALFGYHDNRFRMDSRKDLSNYSIRPADIPQDYLFSTSAHLCPMEYLTHSLLPAMLRQEGFTTITLDPSTGYMDPSYWDDLPAILTGLTAFLVSEEKIRRLFHGRSDELWEMAEALGSYGCEIIVIKRGLQGQYIYDAGAQERWEIPAYPSRDADPTGAGGAFSGGFLAGFKRSYSPVEAALYGNIAASLSIEGSGAFFALDAMPGLASARLETLRQSVRKV